MEGERPHIQQAVLRSRLVLLLHAGMCPLDNSCGLSQCRNTKEILNHISTCDLQADCTVKHCASTKDVLSHWRDCRQVGCAVCGPYKRHKHLLRDSDSSLNFWVNKTDWDKYLPKYQPSSPSSAKKDASPPSRDDDRPGVQQAVLRSRLVLLLHAGMCPRQEGTCTLSQCQNMKTVLEHTARCEIELECPVKHCTSTKEVLSHWRNCGEQRCSVCGPYRRFKHVLGGGDRGYNFSVNNSQSFTPGTSSVSERTRSPNDLLTQQDATPSSLVPPLDSITTVSFLSMTPKPIAGLIKCDQQRSATKPWQHQLLSAYRNHFVYLIYEVMCPGDAEERLKNGDFPAIVTFARKTEADCFEAAGSRDHYCLMISQKIWQIKDELNKVLESVNGRYCDTIAKFREEKVENAEQQRSDCPSITETEAASIVQDATTYTNLTELPGDRHGTVEPEAASIVQNAINLTELSDDTRGTVEPQAASIIQDAINLTELPDDTQPDDTHTAVETRPSTENQPVQATNQELDSMNTSDINPPLNQNPMQDAPTVIQSPTETYSPQISAINNQLTPANNNHLGSVSNQHGEQSVGNADQRPPVSAQDSNANSPSLEAVTAVRVLNDTEIRVNSEPVRQYGDPSNEPYVLMSDILQGLRQYPTPEQASATDTNNKSTRPEEPQTDKLDNSTNSEQKRKADTVVEVKIQLCHRAVFRRETSHNKPTHEWMIFVKGEGDNKIEHFVEKVIFRLPESYHEPDRVIKQPPYLVRELGSTGFNMMIEIYFETKDDPCKIDFVYNLHLSDNGYQPNHVRCEKLTFQNPADDFRQKLIMGGGRIIEEPSSKIRRTEAATTKENSTQEPSERKDTDEDTDVFREALCPICKELLHNCVSLQPCLHSFCAGCYSEWMERSRACPHCRVKVKRISRNHLINNLIAAHLKQNPDKRRPEEDLKALDAKKKKVPTATLR